MNANKKSKKNLKILILVILVCVVFFAGLKSYEWWISNYMSNSLTNQLQELNDNVNSTIVLQNIWGAEKLVACRGYLENSEKLKNNLLEAGFTTSVATEIAEFQRWTEGTHFYLVKNEKVIYFYHIKHQLYMEHLKKDFIYANIGEKIYLDVTVTPHHSFMLRGIR